MSLLVLVFVALSGYAFQMGYWQLPVDVDVLFTSPYHWFLTVVGLTIFFVVCGHRHLSVPSILPTADQ